MANEVGLRIGARVLKRIAHPGLRSQVRDLLETSGCDHFLERFVIGKIQLQEREFATMPFGQVGDPGAFQGRVVILVHIIDTNDGISAGKQPFRKAMADKACSAGDENCHDCPS